MTKAGEKDEQTVPRGTWSTGGTPPWPSEQPYDAYGQGQGYSGGYGGPGGSYGYGASGQGLGAGTGAGQYGSTIGHYGSGGGGYGSSSSSSSLPLSSAQQSYFYSVPTPTAPYPTQPYPPSYNNFPGAGGVGPGFSAYGGAGLGVGVTGGGRQQGSAPSLYDPYILHASQVTLVTHTHPLISSNIHSLVVTHTLSTLPRTL